MDTNRAIASLDEATLSKVEHEPPVRPNKQREKAPLDESRFKSGSVSNTDYVFRDPNFAYVLACGLQNPGDQEVLGQLLTPELRMKTFQGLINVSFDLSTIVVIRVYIIFLHSCCICFHRLLSAFLS